MKIRQNASEKTGSKKDINVCSNGKGKRDSLGFFELLTD